LTDVYLYSIAGSIPVISEQEARESLVDYCDKKCCYGTGAAEAMTIGTMQSTSAFHVCCLSSLSTLTLWYLVKASSDSCENQETIEKRIVYARNTESG